MNFKHRMHVVLLSGLVLAAPAPAMALSLFGADLPSMNVLRDWHPVVPLRVYTEDGALIGEFGDEHCDPVSISQVPPLMKKALLAAEDDRFYEHHGVDFMGVARAAITDVLTGSKREGASTITMQVARNFYLNKDKTFTRKIDEIRLAMKIEDTFSKDQILQFYMNRIYLGERAYGFQAAAETYFGKRLNQLTLGQMAVLAGLPKGPSLYNPIANLARARERQHYVLGRMLALGWITRAQYNRAMAEPIVVHRTPYVDVSADYVAEMVREELHARYGDAIYTSGMKVYTTLRRADQAAADRAVYDGVTAYDRRHGWRGPEGHLAVIGGAAVDARLDALGVVNDMVPAQVVSVSPRKVTVYLQGGEIEHVTGPGLELVRRNLSPRAKIRLKRGDLIRVEHKENGWRIAQLPEVEAAFVAMDPHDGAVRALVGGFDFARAPFNRVTQAWRQPGSSFKPFVYSSALEKGFTPASVLDDAPLALPNGSGGMWTPGDDDGKFMGPITLRTALALSRNLPAIRLLMAVTPQYAQNYITRFGFTRDRQPPYLTMALGAGDVTPMQMAQGYAVFANGGYAVTPAWIEKVVDGNGRVLSEWHPAVAGAGAPRVIDARNAYTITSMLGDVVKYGTGAAASSLGRHDLAGKTGTTNNKQDGWFCGYNPELVAVSWMGFDKPRPLGRGEYGANTALPIWISFMSQALKGVPDKPMPMPPGMVVERVDRHTGLPSNDPVNGYEEVFYKEYAPAVTAPAFGVALPAAGPATGVVPDTAVPVAPVPAAMPAGAPPSSPNH